MTLAALRATLAEYRAWWVRRPSLTHLPDMSTPAAVAHGLPSIKVPGRIQLLWMKLPRAPRGALEDLLSEMEAIERGYPGGGGAVVLTVTRAADGQREWRWARTKAEPPERLLTQRAG